MARVTVEDCIENIPNRFELVMMASRRSRQISAGAPLTLDRDNDKNPVVSLREIAEKTINLDNLREEVIKSYQKTVEPDLMEDDLEELSFNDDDGATEMMSELTSYSSAQANDGAGDEMEIIESLGEMDENQ